MTPQNDTQTPLTDKRAWTERRQSWEHQDNIKQYVNADFARDLERALSAARAERDACGAAMEADRSELASATSKMKAILKSREWLKLGRGSYEYNDDRWRDEFKVVYEELHASMEGLAKIAADWTHCPREAVEINAIRTNWQQRATAAEAELSALRDRLAGAERDAARYAGTRAVYCAERKVTTEQFDADTDAHIMTDPAAQRQA